MALAKVKEDLHQVKTVTRSQPKQLGPIGLLVDFVVHNFEYREYLRQSVARDLRKRYKRSALGYLWSMLHPLFMMLILAVVFSNIMRFSVENYAVFLFAGMLPWNYFMGTSMGALGVIRANAQIIDQVAVPKYIFILSIAFSNLANLLLSVLPLLAVMLIVGRSVPITILALPAVILPLFLFSVGLALILSVANVFFEDVGHLAGLVLQALYFLSPVLYSREMLPEWLIRWVVLNPMFGLIEFMRDMVYYGKLPELQTYFLNFGGCILVLILGLWIFKKSENKLIYFM